MISTSWQSPSFQTNRPGLFRLIRMLCWPFLSPLSISSLLPGGSIRSINSVALLSIRNFRLASACSSFGYRLIWIPSQMLAVSFVPKERIIGYTNTYRYYCQGLLRATTSTCKALFLKRSNIEFSCAAASTWPGSISELHSPIRTTFQATTATIC